MIEICQTATYLRWFAGLTDLKVCLRIDARIRRVSVGNFGDAKSVGGGVSELRIDYGPGYRIYFTRRSNAVVILLAGGDKRTQKADMEAAKRAWRASGRLEDGT